MRDANDVALHGPEPQLPRALGDSGLQYQTLESLASAKNYHDWLTSRALPYLGDCPIELGSGLSDYASCWLRAGLPHIKVTEVDADRLALLKERFREQPRVSVTGIDVFNPPPGQYSSFVAVNVLEHIPDQVRALRAAHAVVRPGGAVIIFVPAFEFAMSRFDRQVGHVRRYTVGFLTAAMRDAGLVVDTARDVNISRSAHLVRRDATTANDARRRDAPGGLGRLGRPTSPRTGVQTQAFVRAIRSRGGPSAGHT
jgi:SAM-dependent methyltransferase